MRGEGFLAKNISALTGALESILSAEEISGSEGFLQRLDPRIKILGVFICILAVGLLHSFWTLALLGGLIILLCVASVIPLLFFAKRIFLFIPVFTLVIALPALFITPGSPLVHVTGNAVITEQGLRTAGLLLLRVTESLSFGVLLILTTPWNRILAALRWFRVPAVFVDILSMTYRYIFILLHTSNSMFFARRSRTLGRLSGGENRRWLGRTLSANLIKSHHMSEEVYLSMMSRGYQGEMRLLDDFSLRTADLVWLGVLASLITILLLWNYLWT